MGEDRERIRMRVAWLSVEIQRIDESVGQWSALFPDGAPMCHAIDVLMRERGRLETELWALGSSSPFDEPAPARSLITRLMAWRRARPDEGVISR